MARFTKKPLSSAAEISLEKKLMKYALAGGALLGVPFSASAGLIYSGVINQPVAGNNSSFTVNFAAGASFALVTQNFGSASSSWQNLVRVNGTGTTFVDTAGTPAAMAFGSLITTAAATHPGDILRRYGVEDAMPPGYKGGNWPTNGTAAYLGLSYTFAGQQFTGWALISAHVNGALGTESANLVSYAFDTTAGESITAGQTSIISSTPEPASLALFALGGGTALALLRRRRAAARLG